MLRRADPDLDLPPVLPRDRAFTYVEFQRWGISRRLMARLVESGRVRRLFKGLYVVAEVELTITVRARALALVLPAGSVVTDTTAAWLHGVDVLGPVSGDELPPLTVFVLAGCTRLRNGAVRSGTRTLLACDVTEVEGVRVTTPLRTALDLGRLLRRDRAIAALDGLLRTGAFRREALLGGVDRFKGFRGVIQLRGLAPLADPRAESPAESKLRLEWLDAGITPAPTPQVRLPSPYSSQPWRFDLGVEELRYAVEYDGKPFHDSPEQQARDRSKRDYARDVLGWTVDVLTQEDVYGRTAYPAAVIRQGLLTARHRQGEPRPTWRWPGRA